MGPFAVSLHAAFHEPGTRVYRWVQGTVWTLILLSILSLVIEALLPQTGLPLMRLPGLTVSTAMTDANIPVGVQIVGGRYREDTMLAAGEIIEVGNTPFLPVDPASA